MKTNRPCDVLKSATAIVFFAMALGLGLSGLAQQTKPGSVSKNSRGGYSFTGSTIGGTKQSGKNTPTPQPKSSPSPKKKGCEQEKSDKKTACGDYNKVYKEWHDQCVDHYEKNKSACDHGAIGAGLGELATKCKQATDVLDKCEGKKPPSPASSAPSPSPCDQLADYVEVTYAMLNSFKCECSAGDRYYRNYQMCEKITHGQSVQAYIDSQTRAYNGIAARFKRDCSGHRATNSIWPCSPSDTDTHCWELGDKFVDCMVHSRSSCVKEYDQWKETCRPK